MRPDKDVLHWDSRAKYAVVGSTGQRNGTFESNSRRLEAKRFPRPRVELQRNLIKVTLGVDG